MPVRAEKYSLLKLGHNISVYLRLRIYYEHNLFTRSTTITTSHFALRVVSAEFQTSRSEAHQQSTLRKLSLLDSHPYNLPNSTNKFLYYQKHRKDRIFQITKLKKLQYVRNIQISIHKKLYDISTDNCSDLYLTAP